MPGRWGITVKGSRNTGPQRRGRRARPGMKTGIRTRATYARRAYFAQLAYKSAKKRSAKGIVDATEEVAA